MSVCLSVSSCCLLALLEYDQPHESQTNKDIIETINRKGLGGFGPGKSHRASSIYQWMMTPIPMFQSFADSPEGDAEYSLNDSPKPNEPIHESETDFQDMMQNRNNQINATGIVNSDVTIEDN